MPYNPDISGRLVLKLHAFRTATTRRPAALFLLALSFFASASRAQICDCIEPPPPCQEAPRADAVFLGRVLKLDDGKIEFSAERCFKGVSVGKIEAIGMPGCSPTLKADRTYVVYAMHMESGVLAVSSCSRTRSIEAAAEDLEFLDEFATQSAPTRISGTVRYRPDDKQDRGDNRPPLPGVKVV